MMSQKVEMHDGVAQGVFGGLPEGLYAIRSFADENGNGKLDTNLIGLPVERYGFANDARRLPAGRSSAESAMALPTHAPIAIVGRGGACRTQPCL